jgi:hypothetical protein
MALALLEDLGYEIVDSMYTPEPVPATDLFGRMLSLLRKGLYALNQDLAVRLLGGYKLLVLVKG